MSRNTEFENDLANRLARLGTAPISIGHGRIHETEDAYLTDPIRCLRAGRSPIVRQPDIGRRVLEFLEAVARRHPVRESKPDRSGRSYGRDSGAVDVSRYLPPDMDARKAVQNLSLANEQACPEDQAPWHVLRSCASKLPLGARVRDMDRGVVEYCLKSLVATQISGE
jgi:hypothetical protein